MGFLANLCQTRTLRWSLWRRQPEFLIEILSAPTKLFEETGLLALEACGETSAGGELEAVGQFIGACGEAGMTLSQALTELKEVGCVPVPSPRAGQRNVVRVMNLHKAKGLEARVVFLAAPTSGLPVTADHFVHRQDAVIRGALCIRKYRKPLAHHPEWDDFESQELAYIAAERHRLLYVAATRARETLIVGRWSGSHASALRPWSALEPFLDHCPELPQAPAEVPEAAAERSTTIEQILALRQQCEALRHACCQPSWKRAAVTANNSTKGFSATLPPDGVQGEGPAWGDLIHKLLEQLVRRPEVAREELESLARWFIFDVPEMTAYIGAALETVERVRTTDFWTRVMGAQQRLVEVPFGLRHEQTLVFGVIDLALRQEEGWDLVDYKTDRKRLDELITAYADQVQEYARSWQAVTEEEVQYAGLYGIREGLLSALIIR